MANADEKAALSSLKEQFKHKKAQERGTSNKKLFPQVDPFTAKPYRVGRNPHARK
jgi:hypothetical protein